MVWCSCGEFAHPSRPHLLPCPMKDDRLCGVGGQILLVSYCVAAAADTAQALARLHGLHTSHPLIKTILSHRFLQVPLCDGAHPPLLGLLGVSCQALLRIALWLPLPAWLVRLAWVTGGTATRRARSQATLSGPAGSSADRPRLAPCLYVLCSINNVHLTPALELASALSGFSFGFVNLL